MANGIEPGDGPGPPCAVFADGGSSDLHGKGVDRPKGAASGVGQVDKS